MIGQLIYSLKKQLPGYHDDRYDDYNWKLYHHHYQGELEDSKQEFTAKLQKGDYIYKSGNLISNHQMLPLHPNHRLIYETILKINTKSVMEVGCGWGDHLFNLQLLNSKLDLYGIDISKEQLKMVNTRSPQLNVKLNQFDITLPYSNLLPKVEICFTQAVIMHIKTANSHLVAMANLFNIASKYVILMENWDSHDFIEDIKYLFSNKMIPWTNIYFYYRKSPELGNIPHIVVISAKKLNLPVLTKYIKLK